MQTLLKLITQEDREYAIMYVASVGCPVMGIDDPTIYDAAMVSLWDSERAAMMSRLIRASYTYTINEGIHVSDETMSAYDWLLDYYEDQYFAAKKIEDQLRADANEKIRSVVESLWLKMNPQTIH